MDLKLEEQWVEVIALFFTVVGFILAIVLQTALFSYLSLLIAGFLAGRLYYVKRYKEPIFPFVLLMVGFLVGFLLGGFWVNRVWAMVIFTACWLLSYYLHLKEILVIFKSQRFIK